MKVRVKVTSPSGVAIEREFTMEAVNSHPEVFVKEVGAMAAQLKPSGPSTHKI